MSLSVACLSADRADRQSEKGSQKQMKKTNNKYLRGRGVISRILPLMSPANRKTARGLKYFKFNFVFSKTGPMRYISHLDLMRLLMRAARRGVLPLYFTEGFSPHPKLRIKRALKLGIESEHEEAEILITRKMNLRLFQNKLNRQLPEGICIKEARILS